VLIELQLNIKPLHDDTRNCLEDIYVTVATWWNREYAFLFLHSWSFGFMPSSLVKKEFIGDRITLNRSRESRCDKQELLLEKYHGIRVEWKRFGTMQEIISVIENEIMKYNPVCLYIDSFWCPWNPAYKKFNINHFFLATGIDKEKRIIYCIDPFYSKKVELLSFENLAVGGDSYITFELLEDQNRDCDLLDIIREAISVILGDGNRKSDFALMRALANEVKDSFDGGYESEGRGIDDLWSTPLIRMLEQLYGGRKNFLELVKQIAIDSGREGVEQIAQELEEIFQNWIIIKGLFIKAMIRPSTTTNEKIAKLLLNTANREENIANKLLEWFAFKK
jgi:hypothetical protein